MLLGLEYNDQLKGLVASYFNKQGKVDYMSYAIPPNELFNWKKARNPTRYRAHNDNYVEQDPTTKLDRFREEELYLTYFSEEERAKINDFNLPKKYFLDIEVYVDEDGTFPKPELSAYPVNLISIVTNENVLILTTFDQFTEEETLSLKVDADNHLAKFKTDLNVHVRHYATEKELLEKFFHLLLPSMPLITGWNVIDFDWQYLFNRASKNNVNILKELSSNSLYGKYHIPIHVGMIDYIDAMLKFRPLKMVENNTLDYISERVLGVKKLANPYKSFYEFMTKDPVKFTLYNIIDSVLVKLIDDKLDLITTSCMISKISETELNRIFGPVFMSELFLMRGFYKNGKHLYTRPRASGIHKKYEGAFVYEPVPGYYENVVAFDFSSMYPHIQIQFNISPDSFLGMLRQVNTSQLIEGQYVVTKNDTVFDLTFDSVTKVILQKFYNRRKEAVAIIDEHKLLLKQNEIEV